MSLVFRVREDSPAATARSGVLSRHLRIEEEDCRYQEIAGETVWPAPEVICGHQEPSVHAQAVRNRGTWIRGVMDPVANGRHQMDGYGLMDMYGDLGLDLEAAENLLESGILEVRQRMSTGRLKVFATLHNYLEELRLYRRDERGQIVTDCDYLQNATRCLVVSGMSRMRTEPVKEAPGYRCFDLSGRSWMA